MEINDALLGKDEKISLTLRSLYRAQGYSQFKMRKFEEYDLYMRNKEFLISEGIITFNDTDGKLLALKPDVTLSIIKYARDLPGQVQKLFYTENVYRISESSHAYKEIMQTGLECIGETTPEDTAQVIRLAVESAEKISPDYRAVFTHIGFVDRYLEDLGLAREPEARKALSEKNTHTLEALYPQALQALLPLMQCYPGVSQAQEALLPFCSGEAAAELMAFDRLMALAFPRGCPKASVDFSLATTAGYYSGVAFKCYVAGVAVPVLSGGQYDGLMQKLGRSSRAIGFAVYLDALEHLGDAVPDPEGWLNIALPKGRLGEKVYAMFEKAGYDCPAIREENRKLIFENPQKKVRYFWVKPSDVAIYVARGAADVGVAGSDILEEYAPDVYELCDLGLGKCRMAVAAKQDFRDDETRTLRVATKFRNIANRYYAEKCRDIDIIHLNGSIELAPILGLADVIVDIVETGKTLLENGLAPRETVCDISARLIANKAAYRFKKDAVEALGQSIAKQVKEND